MFEARLESCGVLKGVIEAVRELVQDTNLECKHTGIELHAVDSNNVCFINCNLRSTAFSHYRCDANQTLGLNLTNWSKLLKCANNEDATVLRTIANQNKLNVKIEGTSRERISSFDLKLLDLDTNQIQIKDLDIAATVTMAAIEFQHICRDSSVVGETVTLTVKENSITFVTDGDLGNADISVTQQPGSLASQTQIANNRGHPVSMSFSLKYLSLFCRATTLSTEVTLMFSDALLVVVYLMADIGFIKYYIAPVLQ